MLEECKPVPGSVCGDVLISTVFDMIFRPWNQNVSFAKKGRGKNKTKTSKFHIITYFPQMVPFASSSIKYIIWDQKRKLTFLGFFTFCVSVTAKQASFFFSLLLQMARSFFHFYICLWVSPYINTDIKMYCGYLICHWVPNIWETPYMRLTIPETFTQTLSPYVHLSTPQTNFLNTAGHL